jgi:hypothetical protein
LIVPGCLFRIPCEGSLLISKKNDVRILQLGEAGVGVLVQHKLLQGFHEPHGGFIPGGNALSVNVEKTGGGGPFCQFVLAPNASMGVILFVAPAPVFSQQIVEPY